MKSKIMKNFIVHAICIFLYYLIVLTAHLAAGWDKSEIFMYFAIITVFYYMQSLFFAGITSIIVRIITKKSLFYKSFTFGVYIYLITFYMVAIGLSIFKIDMKSSNIVLLAFSAISALLTILHAVFYKKAGFFYNNFLISIIEKIFNIKINKKESKAQPEGKKTTEKAVKEKSAVNSGKKEKKNLFQSILSSIKGLTGKIKEYSVKNRKNLIKKALPAMMIIFLLIIGFNGTLYIQSRFYAKIVEYSPKGETTGKTVIKVLYSSDITFAKPDSPGKVFTIAPAISGIAKIEGRTLYFIPDKELPDSARYEVTVNGKALKSKGKMAVKGIKFSINTTIFNVLKNSKFYFEVEDEALDSINALIGEIIFTLPVNVDTLKDRVEIELDGKKIDYRIDESDMPHIVYFRITGISRTEKVRNVKFTIKKGVEAVNGVIPLENDFAENIKVDSKKNLSVEKLDIFPVKGTTYIALKFNQPVDAGKIKDFIKIDPPIAYNVQSEYRFIILQADFKVNTNYTVQIDKMLTAKNGMPMTSDYSNKVYVRDIEPAVNFTSAGKILPLTDNLNIEFSSINLDEVKLRVEKVYKNNIVNYESDSESRKYLHESTLKIEEGELNKEVINLINLNKFLNTQYKGMYIISLGDPQDYYNMTSMTVNITEMGMIIKNDNINLTAFIVDLMKQNPMPNVKVSLISHENQFLQESYTDAEGRVSFNNYKLTQENLNPYLLLAERNDDFTYLVLSQNTLDYSTFDVDGNVFNRDIYEAFARTERGLYRPGEDVYTSLIVRKSNLTNPESIPLIVKSSDPAGSMVFEETVKIDENGIRSIKIPTKSSFKTGEYSINIYQDNKKIIGSTNYKIEEFIPNTIDVKLSFIEYKDKKITFKVKSNELHGAPAKNLMVNCDIRFTSRTFKSKKFPDYIFYNDNKKDFYETKETLGSGNLDDNGEKVYQVDIPSGFSPPSALDVRIYADVYDTSNRPVGAYLVVPVDVYNTYYGVKIEGEKPFLKNNKINIQYAAVNPGDNAVSENEISLKIERKIWYSIFQRYSWRSGFASETYREVLYNGKVNVNRTGVYSFVPDKGGEYLVTFGNKKGMMTTSNFFVHDEKATTGTDLTDPYKLTLSGDKNVYMPGETAYITILSPFDGKCLITAEREKTYFSQFVDIVNGRALVTVNINDAFIPNMYITAMAFRKPDYSMQNIPPVSYGAFNITFDKKRMSQQIIITAKEKIRAADGLQVNLNLPSGGGSKVIIAAVDEGILQLSNYITPEPYDYFYRKRGLSVRTNTTLKDLLPDIAPYKKAFGGGEEGDLERRHLNPIEAKRVKSASFYSDVLTCDPNGNVSYNFKIPEFNGKLRIMAMSASNKRFGAAQSNVTVTDPIVLSPGIPRFLASGDICSVPVRVFNKTGSDGNIKVSLTLEGPLKLAEQVKSDIFIKNENEEKIIFRIKADNDAGVGKIIFTAEGLNERTRSETELAIRPASSMETTVSSGDIEKSKPAEITLPQNFIAQGKYLRLSVSGSKIIKYAGALDYLVQYPYGCTEQLVSSAFPLLYLKDIVQYSSFFSSNKVLIDKYINNTLKQIEERHKENGGFVFWPGSMYVNEWISDYASHFIIEAKKAGYPVSAGIYDKIVIRLGLKETEKGKLDRRDQNILTKYPYHLYLKALAGKPDFDSMRFFYDEINKKDFREKSLSETDRCFLAAGYALVNDREKARAFLPDNFMIKTAIRQYTGNFDSYIRNSALYLYALSLIDPNDKNIPKLENTFVKFLAKNGSLGNTQETAWALIALSEVFKIITESIDVDMMIDGKFYKKITGNELLTNRELKGAVVTLKNNGNKTCYFNFAAYGTPLSPDFIKVNQGLKVEKEYLNIDGTKLDIKQVKKGTKIAVVLKLSRDFNFKKEQKNLENLVLIDLLPSGFEIENTRIESRGELSQIPSNDISIDYSDIRDDRIVIFPSDYRNEIRYTYIVNAVSTGEFIIPQFSAELMYDPDIYGKTAGGEKVIITE